MKRVVLLILFVFVSICSQAQTAATAAILESDPLGNKAVFYVPSITTAQLNNIKNEFANYPQIESAQYVYQGHNCILVDLGTVSNPSFVLYRDLLKLIVGYVSANEVFMKSPTAYSEILNGVDSQNFILK